MDLIGWQFTPYILPVLGAAVLLAALAAYAWQQREDAPGTWVFVALTGLSSWWCFTYALELMSTDPETMLLWVQLEWISIALLPVTWLLFALIYTGRARYVRVSTILLLAALPLGIIALAWTTPAHTLLYANPGVTVNGRFVAFDAERGPAFYVHVIYSYALVLTAVALLYRLWRRSIGQQRALVRMVLIGALLPLIGNAIYQLALLIDRPIYVDLTVLAFAVSGLLFTWGWFRLRLSDLVPELVELAPGTPDTDAADLSQSTQRRTLNLVSLGLAILLFVALVPILTLLFRADRPTWYFRIAYLTLFLVSLIVALWRHGPYGVRAAGLSAVYLGLALLDLRINGLTPTAGLYIVAYAAFVAILFNGRAAAVALAIGAIGLLLDRPAEGVAPVRDIYSLTYLLLSFLMSVGLLLVGLFALRRDSQTLLRRARHLARELDLEREQLEQRVAERTRALETSATISRQLSTILDQTQLVREVVEQLRVAFAYYHVHIFLWDDESRTLRMAGGTGEAGQAMLVMGHALRPSEGLVGRAFSTNRPVVVPDVNQDPGWLPNRLLPGTLSEIAVPINYADEILGVLDVQDSEVNGLGVEDAQLLEAIAGQLAVALRNARLVAQVQQEAEQAALINTINRKIVQTIDMNGAIQVAAAELSRALEAGGVAVRLDATGGRNGHDR